MTTVDFMGPIVHAIRPGVIKIIEDSVTGNFALFFPAIKKSTQDIVRLKKSLARDTICNDAM